MQAMLKDIFRCCTEFCRQASQLQNADEDSSRLLFTIHNIRMLFTILLSNIVTRRLHA